jgi:phage anti-repressor protein
MEKLKELLKGIGASEELTSAICEELERYSGSLKARYEQEYQAKITRAKQVCIEEVNKEKANLARKVQIFLESKAAAMEQAVASKRAIEETASTAKLKKAKAVLEGVEITDNGVTNQDLQDAQKKIARLERANTQLREERGLAIDKANTANDVAAKALQRNRKLEEHAGTLKEGYCTTHHLPYPKAGKCAKCGGGSKGEEEAPKKAEEKVEEGKKRSPARRLDESRTIPAGGKSTRRTLTESQTRKDGPVSEIQQIAENLES